MKKYSLIIIVIFFINHLIGQESEPSEIKSLKNSKQLICEGSHSGEGYISDGGKAQFSNSGCNDEYAWEQLGDSQFRKKEQGNVNISFSPGISKLELQEKLSYLASDELEGRMTGSNGIKLAAKYISAIFENQGLISLAGKKDYFWPFDFVSEIKVNEKANSFLIGSDKQKLNKDYKPFASTANGKADGMIVFAGYGLKISDGKEYEYDSYANLDVKDKIVLVLDDYPEKLDEKKEKLFERSIASGYKQMIARQNGAKAILIVSGRISGESSREIVGTSGIISLAISEQAADTILAGNNESVESLKEKLQDGDPKGLKHLFETVVSGQIETQVDRIIKQDNNVVGVVPSDNPEADFIFIGAHYDHLGFGEVNSRSTGENAKKIHNGADDNGSGTVAVIELAEYFSGLKKENTGYLNHHLVFCLWSGEELGLLGSNNFASKLPVPKEKVKAYLNFDMVGRVEDNKLEIQGLGSAREWKSIFEKNNIVSDFDLLLGEDPYLPTDATSFYLQGIPVASFFSGIHLDYHTHTDDVELINFEDMYRVTTFSSLIIKELMMPTQLLTFNEVQVKRRKSSKGALSVSLGTIPAYAGSDEPGVAIQGVRPGGPADKAELKANDVIVGLNGKEVSNIYDFMNILSELKPDVEADIVVLREGNKETLKIIPEAKK